jgi:hypothetical protein
MTHLANMLGGPFNMLTKTNVDFFTQQQIEHGQANIHLRCSDASEYSNAPNDPIVIFSSAGADQGCTYQLSEGNSGDHLCGMAGAIHLVSPLLQKKLEIWGER